MATAPLDPNVDQSPQDRPTPAHTPAPTPSAPRPVSREWLETDGRGGFASSTPELCPTRRYHGLLIAPGPDTAERYLYLSRFDERLVEAGEAGGTGAAWPFSVARYPGTLAPRGDLALESFQAEAAPRAVYRLGEARLARTVLMPRGSSAVLVRYELLEASGPRTLELRPIVPYRRADHLTIENDAIDLGLTPVEGGFRVRPYAALPALAITASVEPTVTAEPVWFRDLVFEDDRERGYGGREDEPSPALMRFELQPGASVTVAAALDEPLQDPEAAFEAELKRRDQATRQAGEDPVAARLDRAADAFLYRTPVAFAGGGERTGILAGFPWFLEWGRDTFLALPGLTLARGQLDACAEVLTGALPYLKEGLLPNIFGTTTEDSHYGSADAALWFARAVLLFDRAGGSRTLIKNELQPALESIAEAYLEGTELGLFVDDDGLLNAGTPELNPTWMDARTSAGPVTPRHGCPVEIAALWCSLLAHLEELARSKTVKRARADLRKQAKKAFLERFWMEDEGYLADNWSDGERDTAVRPNMVLAAALELAPLTKAQRARIVARAEAELVTPRGLRTLSPNEPEYCQRYTGGPEERDAAYHQGTVWPWLMGFFTEAALRSTRPTRSRVAYLEDLWKGLEPELERAGLDHLSEVFDAEPPHTPGGTFAQAWNTAEWLRARRMLADRRP